MVGFSLIISTFQRMPQKGKGGIVLWIGSRGYLTKINKLA
jgi:hypothetical protein